MSLAFHFKRREDASRFNFALHELDLNTCIEGAICAYARRSAWRVRVVMQTPTEEQRAQAQALYDALPDDEKAEDPFTDESCT
jgi:hypothetical protein